MPKLSHAQAITEMETVLNGIRKSADRLPPLATEVADRLEIRIAQARQFRILQQALLAKQMAATAELDVLIAAGNRVARTLRAYVVLALGTKSPLLSGFGIAPRGRRPSRSRRASSRRPLRNLPDLILPVLETDGPTLEE